MYGDSADEYGGDGVTGDAQRERGSEGTRRARVVRGLRWRDPPRIPPAEGTLVPACEALGFVVGNERPYVAARPRDHPDDKADHRGPYGRRGELAPFGEAEAEPSQRPRHVRPAPQTLVLRQGLRNPEEADEHGNELDAGAKLGQAEGEPGVSLDRVQAYGGDGQA